MLGWCGFQTLGFLALPLLSTSCQLLVKSSYLDYYQLPPRCLTHLLFPCVSESMFFVYWYVAPVGYLTINPGFILLLGGFQRNWLFFVYVGVSYMIAVWTIFLCGLRITCAFTASFSCSFRVFQNSNSLVIRSTGLNRNAVMVSAV